SGETPIESANPASIRSLGANERRVRFPPLRPTLQGSLGLTKRNRSQEPRARGATPPFQGWDTTVRTSLAEVQILTVVLRSQSVQGTAAAHTRARDGSIPSTATRPISRF